MRNGREAGDVHFCGGRAEIGEGGRWKGKRVMGRRTVNAVCLKVMLEDGEMRRANGKT